MATATPGTPDRPDLDDLDDLALPGLVSTRFWDDDEPYFSVTGSLYDPSDPDDSNYAREEAVAARLSATHPDLLSAVTFDSESGMFCAYTTTVAAARAVVEAAAQVCSDWYSQAAVLARRAALDEALGNPLTTRPDRQPRRERHEEAVRRIRGAARRAAAAEADRLAASGWFDD